MRSLLNVSALLAFLLIGTSVLAQPTKGFAWRVWIEREDTPGKPVTVLWQNTSYQINAEVVAVDDLTKLAARTSPTELLRAVNEDLAGSAASRRIGQSKLLWRLLLIHDETYFGAPEHIWHRMELDFNKITAHLDNELKPVGNTSVSNRVTFPIQTANRIPVGRAYLALAAFNDGLTTVHDEVAFAECTANDSRPEGACSGLTEIAFGLVGRDTYRDSAPDDPNSLRGMPDAAITVVHVMENKPLIGILRINKTANARSESALVWSLGTQTMKDLVENLENIPAGLTGRFDIARSRGESLYNALISPGSANPEAQAARSRFEGFVKTAAPYAQPYSPNAPSIAMRIVAPATVVRPPRAYPLGAMWVPIRRSPIGGTVTESDRQGLFMGHHFRIELPLATQKTQSVHPCISQWTFVGPPLGLGDKALQLAREQVPNEYFDVAINGKDEAIVLGDRRFPVKTIDAISAWMKATDVPQPSAISFVSHHAANRLYFTDKDGFQATDVGMKFNEPSFAILNGCTTVSGSAVKSQFLEQLNATGIEAMIATVAPVNGDLAGHFTACMISTLDKEKKSRLTLAELFRRTRYCVHEEKKGGSEILKYVFLGNSRLEICAPGEE